MHEKFILSIFIFLFIQNTFSQTTSVEKLNNTDLLEMRNLMAGFFSWDRGWDAENNLIWGPEKGGYRFEKIK